MSTTTYDLTCLSPVHVGTGNTLGPFDGVAENGAWHRIDLDDVLSEEVSGSELANAMNDPQFDWRAWLRDYGIPLSEVAAYALPCFEDPAGTLVHEGIKDAYNRPYLPGSSIKGAIRTAVVIQLVGDDERAQTFAFRYLVLCTWAQDIHESVREKRAGNARDLIAILADVLNLSEEKAPDWARTLCDILGVPGPGDRQFTRRLSNLGKRREWLGQAIEKQVMGRNPNVDLFRALQVADTEPGRISDMELGRTWTYTLRGNRLEPKRETRGEYKTDVEWLATGTTLRLSIRADDFLLDDRKARAQLRFRSSQTDAIHKLADTCNAWAKALIAHEVEFYRAFGPPAIAQFYDGLAQEMNGLPEGAFLLNVGWGGGWEMKTLGDLIREILGDDFGDLRKTYRLGKASSDEFPKTRRIAYEKGAPRWPLGWVRLTPRGA